MKKFLIILSVCFIANIQAQHNMSGYVFIQRDTMLNDSFSNFNKWEMYKMYNCSESDMGLLEMHKAGEPDAVFFKLLSIEDTAYHGNTKVGVNIKNGEASIDSAKKKINLKCKNQSKTKTIQSFQIPEANHAILANLAVENGSLVLNFYNLETIKLGKTPLVAKQMVIETNPDTLCLL